MLIKKTIIFVQLTEFNNKNDSYLIKKMYVCNVNNKILKLKMMTKKVFFSFWLLLVLGMTTVVFNACSKDDEPKQEETNPGTPDDPEGVIINGVKWATRNVDTPGTFAATPESFGMLYQWNRNIAWSVTNPMISSNGDTTWDRSFPTGTEWEKSNDPSPSGWRVPTLAEIQSLLDTDRVDNLWTTQNGVNGKRFTDKATGNTLFLPAAGGRTILGDAAIHSSLNGRYWSNMSNSYGVHYLGFFSLYAGSYSLNVHTSGFSVRSVAE